MSCTTNTQQADAAAKAGRPDGCRGRVLIYANTAYMIERFNMMNISMLQDMGYTVDVACNFEYGNPMSEESIRRFKARLKDMGVECHQLPLTRKVTDIRHNGAAFMESIRLMREHSYSFVHCHTPVGSVIARTACRITGTRVIYTAHGFHFFDGAPRSSWLIYYPVEKLFSYITDVLITINREDYKRAAHHFGMKRLEYVPGIGIDMSRYGDITADIAASADDGDTSDDMDTGFGHDTSDNCEITDDRAVDEDNNTTDDTKKVDDVQRVGCDKDTGIRMNNDAGNDIRNAVRAELGVSDDTFLILSVGELSKRKNHIAALKAFARIESHHAAECGHRSYMYIIAGTGVYHEELKGFIDRHGLGDRIRLLGYREDADRLYKAADAFLFPSYQEGLPAALMEAMASGLPVAASRIRGNTDLMDEQGGILFETGQEPRRVDFYSEQEETGANSAEGIRSSADAAENTSGSSLHSDTIEFAADRLKAAAVDKTYEMSAANVPENAAACGSIDICTAIVQLLGLSADRLKAMGSYNHDRIRNGFSAEIVAARLRQIYEDI